jgi:hypothetical protein
MNESKIAAARKRLEFARGRLRGAHRAAELGDLLPGNSPTDIARHIKAAEAELAEAEAELQRLLSEPSQERS